MSGDGRFDLVVSGFMTVSVQLGLVPTRTALAASPALVAQGTPLTLTATVTVPAPWYGTPADSVRFFDGTTPLGTSPVIAGVAGLISTASRPGERSLTAVHKGDAKLFGRISTARVVVKVVTPTAVPEGGPAGFALDAVGPNPAPAGRLLMAFELPVATPAWLELPDVAGRRVSAREVGALGPGRHVLDFGAGLTGRAGYLSAESGQGHITYVPTWAGFLYLAVVLDVFSRRIVGWAMANHLRTELILEALDMAVWCRRPENVIHHSDQGCQYTSLAFGARCREAGVRPSMGSIGDCFDNAMCESFFATLECELLNRYRFATQAQARDAVFRFIEGWYNTHRRHSAIGQVAPIRFERRHQAAVEGVTSKNGFTGCPQSHDPVPV